MALDKSTLASLPGHGNLGLPANFFGLALRRGFTTDILLNLCNFQPHCCDLVTWTCFLMKRRNSTAARHHHLPGLWKESLLLVEKLPPLVCRKDSRMPPRLGLQ